MSKQSRAEKILREELGLWPCSFLGEAGGSLVFRYEENNNILVCEPYEDESKRGFEQFFVMSDDELLDFCVEAPQLFGDSDGG